MKNILRFMLAVVIAPTLSFATEYLSYSGRLVNADGSPVSGPVTLRFDLAYSNDPSTVVCFKNISGVPLSNGVFHTKIDFDAADCGGTNLKNILLATPATHTPVMRVVDTTNSKTYSYQAFHAMPFSLISDMAKTLSPLPASDIGKVLQWNGTTWEPATLGTGSGSVTSVGTGTGLTGGPVTSVGTISIANGGVGTTQIADGAVTDVKIAGVSRGKIAAGTANHVLVNDGSGNFASTAVIALTQGGTGANTAADARTNLGLGAAATAGIAYATGSVMPGFAIPTCVPGYKLHFTGVGPTWWSCVVEDGGDASKLPLAGGTMSGNIAMGGSKVTGLGTPTAAGDAATKSYVDSQISSEQVWTLSSGNVSRPTGFVGLGTNAPTDMLTINPQAPATNAFINVSSSQGGTFFLGHQLGAGYSNGSAIYDAATDNPTANANYYFRGSAAGTMKTQIRADGQAYFNGDVGVGISTPALNATGKVLHVHASGAEAAGVHVTNGSTGSAASDGFIIARWTDGDFEDGPIFWNYEASPITFATNNIPRMRLSASGDLGAGVLAPDSAVHIRAGTATSAPLKLTAGTNLTTPQPGAVEFDGTNLYFTTSGSVRKALATSTGATTIQPAAGTAAAPSYSFDSDTNTGFYSAGADSIGVAAGGASLFTFGSNGLASSTAGGGQVSSAAGSAAQPTFSFAGDTDTGWYSPLADTLAAATAGVERIRINPQGHVGIGTTTITNQLTVRATNSFGQLHLSGGNLDPAGSPSFAYMAPGDLLIGTNREAGQVETDFINGRTSTYGGGFRFYDYNSTTNTLKQLLTIGGDTGFVGIGTSSPTKALDVVAPGTLSAVVDVARLYANAPGTATSRLVFGSFGSTTGQSGAIGAHTTAASTGDLVFSTNNSGLNETMRIKSDGNVGIGTSAPTSKLDVLGGELVTRMSDGLPSGGTGIRIGADGASGPAIGFRVSDANERFKLAMVSSAVNTSAERLGLFSNHSGLWSPMKEIVSFNRNGNVGIGTQSPEAPLHVFNPGTTSGAAYEALRLESANIGPGGGPYVQFKNAASNDLARIGVADIFNRGSAITFSTKAADNNPATASTERLRISDEGNVGIGTAAPNSRLQVNGDITLGVETGSATGLGNVLNFLGPGNNGDAIYMHRRNITFDQSELRINIGDDKQAGDALDVGLNYFADGLWYSLFKVQANGNVGIGRASSTARLHLAAGTAAESTAPLKFTQGVNLATPEPGSIEYDGTNLYFTNQSSVRQTLSAASSSGVLTSSNSVVTPTVYGSTASTGNLTLDSTSNASKGNVLIAPSGGNVGIGVTSPVGMLSNSNSARLDENLNGLGTMALNWTGVSTGYVAGFENFATGGLGHGVLIRTADTSSTTKSLNVITGGTPRFSVAGDGRVTVGQSSTTNLFTVGGPSMALAGTDTLPYGQSHLTIQGTDTARTPGMGAALGFVVPANTDGSNSWEQGRILVTPDNANNGDAQGRMYIQTRTSGMNWPWRNNLTLLSNGNVGVNNTNPGSSLSVSGAGGAGTGPAVMEVKATNPSSYTWATYTSSSGLGNGQSIINLVGKTGSTNNLAYFGYRHIADGSAQNNLTFGLYNVDHIMTINGSRNVGINDGTPQAPLSIGGSNGAFISTHTTAASNYLAGAFGSGMHWNGSNWVSRGDGGSNGGGMMAGQKSGSLNFYVVPNTAGTDRVIPDADLPNFGVMSIGGDRSVSISGGMYARGGAPGANGMNRNGYAFQGSGDDDSGLYSLANGEVSIFTDSIERLKMNASGAYYKTDVTANNYALGPADNSYRGSIYFGYMGDPNHRLYNNYLNQDGEGSFDGIKWNLLNGIRFRTLSGGANEAMRIDANGKIGMGVTTLTEKLEVAGAVKADAFLYNSDSRLKKNITTIENPLDKIMKLRGVNFTWKNSNQKTIGFIAQEVEKVVPELVKTNEQSSFKSVHYSNIIAIVVEAIKELRGENKREVANLKEENQKLKTKVESLEQRLERLEQKAAAK